MDDFSRHQESGTSEPTGFFGKLHVFRSLLYWLITLFQLTEEEQRDAGIVMSDQRYK